MRFKLIMWPKKTDDVTLCPHDCKYAAIVSAPLNYKWTLALFLYNLGIWSLLSWRFPPVHCVTTAVECIFTIIFFLLCIVLFCVTIFIVSSLLPAQVLTCILLLCVSAQPILMKQQVERERGLVGQSMVLSCNPPKSSPPPSIHWMNISECADLFPVPFISCLPLWHTDSLCPLSSIFLWLTFSAFSVISLLRLRCNKARCLLCIWRAN